jgi:hypothetical protein
LVGFLKQLNLSAGEVLSNSLLFVQNFDVFEDVMVFIVGILVFTLNCATIGLQVFLEFAKIIC